MVCKAAHRMCPPPRSLALEANGCFMVWVQPDPAEYKVAARAFARQAGFPRFVLVQRGCNQRAATRESEAKIPGRARLGAGLAAVNTAPPSSPVAFGQC